MFTFCPFVVSKNATKMHYHHHQAIIYSVNVVVLAKGHVSRYLPTRKTVNGCVGCTYLTNDFDEIVSLPHYGRTRRSTRKTWEC